VPTFADGDHTPSHLYGGAVTPAPPRTDDMKDLRAAAYDETALAEVRERGAARPVVSVGVVPLVDTLPPATAEGTVRDWDPRTQEVRRMLRRTAVLAGAALLAGLLAGCADNGSIDLNSIGAQLQQGVDAARGAVDTAKAKAEEAGAAGTDAAAAIEQATTAINQARGVATQGQEAGTEAMDAARASLVSAKQAVDAAAEKAPEQLATVLRSLSDQLDKLAADLDKGA
jgi:hypothetical protein